MRLGLTAALLLLTGSAAYAQIAAAVIAPTGSVLRLDEHGRGVFAVIAINLGSPGGSKSETGYCGGYDIAATGAAIAGVCVLDQATGACASDAATPFLRISGAAISIPPSPAFPTGSVKVFGVLVQGPVPSGRVTVTFTEWDRGTPVWPPRCSFPSESDVYIGAERGAVSIRVVQP